MTEELYNKIDKFCNKTDWKKYQTYEHALQEFIEGLLAEKENQIIMLEAQIEKMKCCENCKHYEDEICKVGHYFECKNCTECGEKDYNDYWE